MKSKRNLGALLFVLVVLSLTTASALAKQPGQAGWKPVNPEDLKQKASAIEKDADAEVLFWEARVQPKGEGAALSHYIRIKIFSERGRDSQSKVEFFSADYKDVTEIAGRTIKADGAILELKPEAIYQRIVFKGRKIKLISTSFALPGVEPGAIIEYRWCEVRRPLLIALDFQKEIPIRSVTYYLPDQMRRREFNLRGIYAKPEEKGYRSVTQTNVPAFRREPYMPPENQVRQWMLVYRAGLDDLFTWQMYGKWVYEEIKQRMKVNDEVRRAALAATGDASTQEQKLERLFEFCRSRIKNINDDASDLTEKEVAEWKENKSPADTLRRGMGTGKDIDLLFAALARAAGFDARYAMLADRSKVFFDPGQKDYYFLDCYNIAVRVGNEWRFFDPASAYVVYGMLRWQEEGQYALLCDPNEPVFELTQISPPEKSRLKRDARLRVGEDGALEGEVRLEYTGHYAAEMKEYYDDETPDEREKALRESLKARMTTLELSDIRVELVTDPLKPFVQTYRVRVPGYAQRAGKRLFLQPAFFQYGAGQMFSTSERKHPVYFHFPWVEEDTVTIELPTGFAPDKFDSPIPLNAGETARYEAKIEMSKDGRKLHYQRKLVFGMGGRILIQTEDYALLRRLFEAIHQRDNHTITLKQSEVVTSTK
jgi:hypothetical protein